MILHPIHSEFPYISGNFFFLLYQCSILAVYLMSGDSAQVTSKCGLHLKGQCTRFFASGFFQESSSPKPLKITKESFRTFLKIRGDIFACEGAPPVSTTPVANLLPVATSPAANFTTGTAGVVYTGGKYS